MDELMIVVLMMSKISKGVPLKEALKYGDECSFDMRCGMAMFY